MSLNYLFEAGTIARGKAFLNIPSQGEGCKEHAHEKKILLTQPPLFHSLPFHFWYQEENVGMILPCNPNWQASYATY